MNSHHKHIIQDHCRNPRNKRKFSPGEAGVFLDNPSCGDRVALKLEISRKGRISSLYFDGEGCSLCMASASMLTGLLNGLNLDEAPILSLRIHDIFKGKEDPDALDEYGDMAALKDLVSYPVRQKCALLPWDSLDILLAARKPRHGNS